MIQKILLSSFVLLLVSSMSVYGQQASTVKANHCTKMQQATAKVAVPAAEVVAVSIKQSDRAGEVSKAVSSKTTICLPQDCDPTQCDPSKCPPKDCDPKNCEMKAGADAATQVSAVKNAASCQPSQCQKVKGQTEI